MQIQFQDNKFLADAIHTHVPKFATTQDLFHTIQPMEVPGQMRPLEDRGVEDIKSKLRTFIMECKKNIHSESYIQASNILNKFVACLAVGIIFHATVIVQACSEALPKEYFIGILGLLAALGTWIALRSDGEDHQANIAKLNAMRDKAEMLLAILENRESSSAFFQDVRGSVPELTLRSNKEILEELIKTS